MTPEPRLATLTVPVAGRSVPFTFFDTPAGRRIALDILEGRTYPPVTGLPDVRTVVDVGANVGAASLLFAGSYPGANVFAFEPYPEAYRLLCRNLAPFPQARAFDFGLFDRDGTAPLFLSRTDAVSNSVGASSHNTGASVPVALRAARPALAAAGVTRIDVLKIDTEGCELPILRSLAGLLPDTRVLYVEYHAEEDRLALDALLRDTHVLCRARADRPHRGELCYVAYHGFPSRADLDRARIRVG